MESMVCCSAQHNRAVWGSMSMKVSWCLRLHACACKQFFNSAPYFSFSVLLVFVETAWKCLWYCNRATKVPGRKMWLWQIGKAWVCIVLWRSLLLEGVLATETSRYWQHFALLVDPVSGSSWFHRQWIFVRFMSACCWLYCQTVNSYCLIQTRDKFPLSSCNNEQHGTERTQRHPYNTSVRYCQLP